MFEWETFPNPLCFSLHVKEVVPRMSMFAAKNKCPLQTKLQEIKGIEEASSTKKYSLHITIGKMFFNADDVNRIKKEVEDLVKAFFSLPPEMKEQILKDSERLI